MKFKDFSLNFLKCCNTSKCLVHHYLLTTSQSLLEDFEELECLFSNIIVRELQMKDLIITLGGYEQISLNAKI